MVHDPQSQPKQQFANFLYGVSCRKSTNCVAVGDYQKTSKFEPLIESWNGMTWSVDHHPANPSGGGNLIGVSCTKSTGCVAVRGYGSGSSLVETQNRTVWSFTTSPNPGTQQNLLASVSCVSYECVAVGLYYNGSGVGMTLVETGTQASS